MRGHENEWAVSDKTMWVTRQKNVRSIAGTDSVHLRAILRGFREGKQFWGQGNKLRTIKKELRGRGEEV